MLSTLNRLFFFHNKIYRYLTNIAKTGFDPKHVIVCFFIVSLCIDQKPNVTMQFEYRILKIVDTLNTLAL